MAQAHTNTNRLPPWQIKGRQLVAKANARAPSSSVAANDYSANLKTSNRTSKLAVKAKPKAGTSQEHVAAPFTARPATIKANLSMLLQKSGLSSLKYRLCKPKTSQLNFGNDTTPNTGYGSSDSLYQVQLHM